jgi:hypothetical protein
VRGGTGATGVFITILFVEMATIEGATAGGHDGSGKKGGESTADGGMKACAGGAGPRVAEPDGHDRAPDGRGGRGRERARQPVRETGAPVADGADWLRPRPAAGQSQQQSE